MELSPDDLAALRRGDVRALEAAFRVYGVRVHRTCRQLLGNDVDADDAAQEVFLRLLDKARTFTGGSRFSTWVYRLTVNLCRNFRRRRRPQPSLDADAVPAATRAPDAIAAGRDALAELDRLLARLGAEARDVLVLREVEELAYTEIAEVLGIPVGTVMSRLARARARLTELAATSAALAMRWR